MNIQKFMHDRKIARLPRISEVISYPVASSHNLFWAVGVSGSAVGITQLIGGVNVAGTAVTCAVSMMVAGLIHQWEIAPQNDGWIGGKPKDKEQADKKMRMNAELTSVYRDVYGTDSITVVLQNSAQYHIHVIYHKGVKINSGIENLARELGIKSEHGKEGADAIPVILFPVWGRGCSALAIPKEDRADWHMVEYDSSVEQPGAGIVAHVGQSVTGSMVTYNRREAHHCLVSGVSGSGKTVGFRSLLKAGRSFGNTRTIIIDPKDELKGVPCDEYTNDLEAGYKLIEELLAECLLRGRKITGAGFANWWKYIEAGNTDLPALELYIDEYPQLKAYGENEKKRQQKIWNQEAKDRADAGMDPPTWAPKSTEDIVDEFLRVYRYAGLFVTIGIQKPDADSIPTRLSDNMDAKWSFRVADKDASRVAIDSNGAQKLLGEGAFLFRLAARPMVMGRAAFIED